MERSSHWIARLAAVGALVVAACEQPPEERMPPEEPPAEAPAAEDAAPMISPEALPEGVTMQMVQEGQAIFTSDGICYTCHGMDATGTQLAPNLTDDEWINVDGTYESIVQVVTTGVPQPVEHPSPMPPMGGAQLSEEQVRSVAAYVYAISHGGS